MPITKIPHKCAHESRTSVDVHLCKFRSAGGAALLTERNITSLDAVLVSFEFLDNLLDGRALCLGRKEEREQKEEAVECGEHQE